MAKKYIDLGIVRGASAFEVWKSQPGNENKTEKEFFESLKGAKGDTGVVDASTTVTFVEASSRENIKSGENMGTILGKVMKFFNDLKTVAFSGSYSDLTNKPTLGGGASHNVANNCTTNVAGSVLDARQGKVLADKDTALENKIDSITISRMHYRMTLEDNSYIGKALGYMEIPYSDISKYGSPISAMCRGDSSAPGEAYVFPGEDGKWWLYASCVDIPVTVYVIFANIKNKTNQISDQ